MKVIIFLEDIISKMELIGVSLFLGKVLIVIETIAGNASWAKKKKKKKKIFTLKVISYNRVIKVQRFYI